MTSKKFFFKLMMEDLKDRIWSLALAVFVFFLSMPVKSALGIAFLVIYLPFVMDMLMYNAEDAILTPVKKVLAR